MRIAMLEDDPDQSALICHWFEDAEHTVISHALGSEFLRGVRRDSFDLYVLDWQLPDVSGLDVLQKLRDELQDTTPVLIATVKNEERDIVHALETGADDYLVKPIRRRELIARAEAVCRRSGGGRSSADVFLAPPYMMNLKTKRASLRDEDLPLTNREFELAMFFFRNASRIVSRAHLLEAIWGIDNVSVSTRTVDTHVSRLRKKMQINVENGWRLSAIYQHGYRLEKVGDADKVGRSE